MIKKVLASLQERARIKTTKARILFPLQQSKTFRNDFIFHFLFHCPLYLGIVTQLFYNRAEPIIELLALTSVGAKYVHQLSCGAEEEDSSGCWDDSNPIHSQLLRQNLPRRTSLCFNDVVLWNRFLKKGYKSFCRTGTTSDCTG